MSDAFEAAGKRVLDTIGNADLPIMRDFTGGIEGGTMTSPRRANAFGHADCRRTVSLVLFLPRRP